MEQNDYLWVVLNGFINHGQHLDSYFFRSYKEAESKHIYFTEYFNGLKKATDQIAGIIKERHSTGTHRYLMVKEQYAREGKKLNIQEPQITQYKFPTLVMLPGSGLVGQLGWTDIRYIYVSILKTIERFTPKIAATVKIKKSKQEDYFKTLKDIFIKESDFNKAIKALRTVKVIDNTNMNLIGSKLKGVMQVWIEILRTSRKQLKHIHDRDLTILLNTHFKNLGISEKSDGKHFRNPINKKAKTEYQAKLLSLL